MKKIKILFFFVLLFSTSYAHHCYNNLRPTGVRDSYGEMIWEGDIIRHGSHGQNFYYDVIYFEDHLAYFGEKGHKHILAHFKEVMKEYGATIRIVSTIFDYPCFK